MSTPDTDISEALLKLEKPARPLEVLVLSPTPTWPHDFGNRKRVYETCKGLKERGHRITFVHYASENDWRKAFQHEAHARMEADWDCVHHIAPSRPLHSTPANGDDHEPDEWWDWAIENQLRWLFERQRFDLFIVTYTWLSKALTFAPKCTLRLLDTIDRFGSRRLMLNSQGIPAEYFHLTDAGEIECLNRADVIWAIKDEECEYFGGVANPNIPVLTAPYVEQPVEIAARKNLDKSIIRFGILGARNNINRSNVRTFLSKALPAFSNSLAPLKIVAAGSMCDDLDDIDHPLLERMGFVEKIEDFYAACDVVLVPMANSSGQKIRVGEALAHGKPIVAYAHAFEGYPVGHKYHACKTPSELIDACIDLAFNPARIAPLGAAAHTSQEKQQARFDAALDDAVCRTLLNSSELTIVLPAAIGKERSLYWARAMAVMEFVRWFGPVTAWYDGEVTELVARRLLEVSQICSLALGPKAKAALEALGLLPARAWSASLSDAIVKSWNDIAWVSPADAHTYATELGSCGRAYIDLLLGPSPEMFKAPLSQTVRRNFVGNSRIAIDEAAAGGAYETLLMPIAYHRLPGDLERSWSKPSSDIMLLASWRTQSLFRAIAPAIIAQLPDKAKLVCVLPEGMEIDLPPGQATILTQSEFMDDWRSVARRPNAAIVLDGASPDTCIIDEMLRRRRIPTLRPIVGAVPHLNLLAKSEPQRPRTLRQLLDAITDIIAETRTPLAAPEDYLYAFHDEFQGDTGWAALWRNLQHTRESFHNWASVSIPAAL